MQINDSIDRLVTCPTSRGRHRMASARLPHVSGERHKLHEVQEFWLALFYHHNGLRRHAHVLHPLCAFQNLRVTKVSDG